MKKIICLTMVLWCSTSVASALADEWEGLSPEARERVELQTREMSALGVPEAQARNMLLQMVRNRFAEQNMIRAQQTVMEAAKNGLPPEPVISKAMEGMAKQAREQRVVAAMETVRDRYAYADRMARSLATEKKSVNTMRQAIADGLAAGMRTADMEALVTQLRMRTRQQARDKTEANALAVQTMLTACTMARLEVGSPEVAGVLTRALQDGYSHREMEQLRHQVATSTQQQSPLEAANRYHDSVGRGDAGSKGSDGSGSGNSGNGNSGGGNGSGPGNSGGGSGAGSNDDSGADSSGSNGSGGNNAQGAGNGSGPGNSGGGRGAGSNDGNGADNSGNGGSGPGR